MSLPESSNPVESVMAPTYIIPSGKVAKPINDQLNVIVKTINQIIEAIANFPNPTVIQSILTDVGVDIPNPPVLGTLSPSPESLEKLQELNDQMSSIQSQISSISSQANELQGSITSTIASATSAAPSLPAAIPNVKGLV